MRRFRSIPQMALAVSLVTLLAGSATATPTVTITQPVAGQSFSKADGPIGVSGTAGFVEPVPNDTRLYLRYEAEGGNNCGRRYLSQQDGPDAGNSCQSTGAHTTLIGQSFTRDWPADPQQVALPLTVDASRNITGQIHITSRALSFSGNPIATPANWVTLDVVVRLGAAALTQSFDSGPFTGGTHTFNVDIDIPANMDKADFSQVQVDLVWHRVVHLSQQGVSVVHTFAELNNPPTFVNVPTYTASFDRRVDLTVDNPGFTGSLIPASVDQAAGTFSASVSTAFIQPGAHTLYARARQGAKVSVDAVPFELTA